MTRSTSVALLMLLAAVGCRRELPRAALTNEAARYSALTLTTQSHDTEVQAEMALLRAEGALPQMLDAARGIDVATGNAALPVALGQSRLASVRAASEALFTVSVDRWNPIALEKSLQFQAKHARDQQAIAQAIEGAKQRLNLPLAGGLKSSTACIDAALVYVRLECISTADAVSRGDGQRALAALTSAFRLVDQVAAEPHVAARLTAAVARRDVLGALQRLVDSRIVTSAHLAHFEGVVSETLAAWPDDASVWIGDRAVGLQIYEMIRAGQLLAVLTRDELQALNDHRGGKWFAAAVMKNVDRDEAYYLQAMRRYIALARLPYYERRSQLDALQAELAALADSPEYPIIADRMLLAGIAQGQRQQAADFALLQAWSMALAVACGRSLPPPQVNPLTGQTYNVTIAGNRVVVAGIDPLRPAMQVTAPIATAPRLSSRPDSASQPR